MLTTWDQTHFFERESSIYTFSANPLLRKRNFIHLYIPWDTKMDFEYMFKIKKEISTSGIANIPLMEKSGLPARFSSKDFEKMSDQITQNKETHLIMSNLESIHVYRIVALIRKADIKKHEEHNCTISDDNNSHFKVWLQVDDMFLLDVNHDKHEQSVINRLDHFVRDTQTQNIFKPNPSSVMGLGSFNQNKRERWVDMNRNLTYDYYMKNCELQDHVYQKSWKFLSRKTQHLLIKSELLRHQGLLHRDKEKWENLKNSFDSNISAVYSELNDLYVHPLVNAIAEYPSLCNAWFEIQNGLVDPRFLKLMKDLLAGDKKQIESMEEFVFYISKAKSFLFTIKSRFTKKIQSGEFLLIENFLCRQEGLVESMVCRSITEKFKTLISIQTWINHIDSRKDELEIYTLEECNLKLSHLLAMMTSTCEQNNVIFRLIQEKTSCSVTHNSFDDEVKSLMDIEYKLIA